MKRNEWLMIGGVVVVALLSWIVIRFVFFPAGKTAVVMLADRVMLEQDLSEDCEIPIHTQDGYNIFVVKDGTASIQEADCPDQICVNHAGISKKGETIVCLPHRLVVEIQK